MLTACVPSLYPLYTERDLVLAPALEGTWMEEDGDTWTFHKGAGDNYKLIYTEKGAPGNFDAHLVRLGKSMFVDLFPQEPDMRNDFYKGHFIRTHTFAWIQLEADLLRMAMMDPDKLKESIEQKKISIGHERLGDEILLTAPTEKLQQLVQKLAEEGSIFGEPAVLRRKK
jgi:hypothetical protein